jgi:integral membrane protein
MTDVRALRLVSLLQGCSLLALLLVAMPLKYLAEMPGAVRIVGSLHGLLFLWLIFVLLRTHLELAWSPRRSLRLLALATLPFGFVAMERELRRA